ncbi:neurofilament medium polypeptide-like [Pleurodeles waltl]|uniref:neurofilament medium polypeptide-like n=1 Tax=Pleurodeles waltl TaxID=8319 RepID=UPI0037097901
MVTERFHDFFRVTSEKWGKNKRTVARYPNAGRSCSEEEVDALKTSARDNKVESTKAEREREKGEPIEIEEGEIFSEDEANDSLGEDQVEASESDESAEGDKEPEAAESDKELEEKDGDKRLKTGGEAGEPDQRRAFPEADDKGKEKESVTDFPERENTTEQSETVQTRSGEVAGPSNGQSVKKKQGIASVKVRIKERVNDNDGAKVKGIRREIPVIIPVLSEEEGSTKKESTSEKETKGDAKLKRKRIPNQRYSGPEWAYVVNDDWADEFVTLSLENEEAELQFENKSFMDSVD